LLPPLPPLLLLSLNTKFDTDVRALPLSPCRPPSYVFGSFVSLSPGSSALAFRCVSNSGRLVGDCLPFWLRMCAGGRAPYADSAGEAPNILLVSASSKDAALVDGRGST